MFQATTNLLRSGGIIIVPGPRDKIAQLISTTSLFGITFRHCAQRSLVMALLSYGKKRTPLWLSRLKASDLLQVVSKHQDFPLVMETYREILQDHFSISDLEDFLSQILRGEIEVHRVQTQTPSPLPVNIYSISLPPDVH